MEITLEAGAEPIIGSGWSSRSAGRLRRSLEGDWAGRDRGGAQVRSLAEQVGSLGFRALQSVKDIRRPPFGHVRGLEGGGYLIIAMELAGRTLWTASASPSAKASPGSPHPKSTSISWTRLEGSTT